MAWGAIAGGIAGGAGGILGAHTSAFGAERQMKFQKKVLKNRYQWAVKDLRKAGMNPILAVTGGGGLAGGTAPGASGGHPISSAGAMEGIMKGITKPGEKKKLTAEEQRIQQDVTNMRQTLRNLRAQETQIINAGFRDLAVGEAALAQASYTDLQRKMLGYEEPAKSAAAQWDRSVWGQWAHWGRRAFESAGGPSVLGTLINVIKKGR